MVRDAILQTFINRLAILYDKTANIIVKIDGYAILFLSSSTYVMYKYPPKELIRAIEAFPINIKTSTILD